MKKENKFFMKKWYFWLAVVILTGLNILAQQETLMFSEYIGVFVGSFIVMTIIFGFIWIFKKVIKLITGKKA